jgi:hypothetical protein
MLVAFDPTSRLVVISSQLAGTHYQRLSGVRVAEPRLAEQRPAAEILQYVWQNFTAQEAGLARHGSGQVQQDAGGRRSRGVKPAKVPLT